jgi:hypothetical protein
MAKLALGSLGAAVLLIAPAAAFNINNEAPADGQINLETPSEETPDAVKTNNQLDLESSVQEQQSSDGSASNSSNLDIHIEFDSSSSSSSSSGTDSEQSVPEAGSSLRINGQDITVPENGSLRQRLKSSDGSATLNISIKNSGSSSQTGGSD